MLNNGFNLSFFQPLGSLSSNNSRYVYSVPGKLSLIEGASVSFENGSEEEITAEFTLLQSLVSDTEISKYFIKLIYSLSLSLSLCRHL